jgi:hypothetical protein
MIKIGLGLGSTYFSPARSGSSSPAGTYEVTVQPFDDAASYTVPPDEFAYVAVVSKTASERWMFVLSTPDSAFPGPFQSYTNYENVTINPAWNAVQVATAIYNAAIAAGFNVTRNNAILTFTASQVGNLPDAVGSPNPTITNGTP